MKVIFTVFLLLFLSKGIASDVGSKYERGDCITPTIEAYSWHGKYARVEAFSRIDGLTTNKAYILSFPFVGASSTIFDKEIEEFTKNVSLELCGL